LKNRRSFACALQIPRALERQALAAVFYPAVAYDCGARSAVVGGRKRIAHQLHGAIGVTREHRLWLATMRARSWVDDFGSTAHWARRLGRMALTTDEPWDLVVSCPTPR